MKKMRKALPRANSAIVIHTCTDYYPFGSEMHGRNYEATDYRYTYQGQEKADKTSWSNFQLRMYDSRIGRWNTTDPKGQYFSRYLAMGNNPVSRIDPDGGSDHYANDEDNFIWSQEQMMLMALYNQEMFEYAYSVTIRMAVESDQYDLDHVQMLGANGVTSSINKVAIHKKWPEGKWKYDEDGNRYYYAPIFHIGYSSYLNNLAYYRSLAKNRIGRASSSQSIANVNNGSSGLEVEQPSSSNWLQEAWNHPITRYFFKDAYSIQISGDGIAGTGFAGGFEMALITRGEDMGDVIVLGNTQTGLGLSADLTLGRGAYMFMGPVDEFNASDLVTNINSGSEGSDVGFYGNIGVNAYGGDLGVSINGSMTESGHVLFGYNIEGGIGAPTGLGGSGGVYNSWEITRFSVSDIFK